MEMVLSEKKDPESYLHGWSREWDRERSWDPFWGALGAQDYLQGR